MLLKNSKVRQFDFLWTTYDFELVMYARTQFAKFWVTQKRSFIDL